MTKEKNIESIRELTNEQRADLEDAYENDVAPSIAAQRFDIPIKIAADYKKAFKARQRASEQTTHTTPASSLSPQTSEGAGALLSRMRQQELEDMQIDELRDAQSHRRQTRHLQIRQTRLDQRQQEIDLRRQERELDTDYEVEDIAPDAPEGDMDEDFDEDDGDDDLLEEFDKKPLKTALKFFDVLKSRQATAQTPTKETPPMRTLTDQEIDAELRSAPQQAIREAKAMIGTDKEPMLHAGLKHKYQLADSDVARVIARMKEYTPK